MLLLLLYYLHITDINLLSKINEDNDDDLFIAGLPS